MGKENGTGIASGDLFESKSNVRQLLFRLAQAEAQAAAIYRAHSTDIGRRESRPGPRFPPTVIHLADPGILRVLSMDGSELHLAFLISVQSFRQNWTPVSAAAPGACSRIHVRPRPARSPTSSIDALTAGSRPVRSGSQSVASHARQSGAISQPISAEW